ncbi:hypothetical protein LGH82_29400 [Mesorhizobium sp. PAMC28654]|uniref:hypothetical protein n=1 Tax=Mesorhizobium sp. PAMC28654 TaxID=2880934 RepID=UPI001D0B1698|nr:hypothetical protein [Mesorhizobium sp. PAMC28654]UDL89145.1 hypothetical protein LGH82_29400 [Mesorhizobium sp. PAMC28654]
MSDGFARACGYDGDSPALLDAFEAIRQCGIRQARQEHDRRKAVIDGLKLGEDMFLAAIGPALSAEEAIEDATRFIIFWRNMPRWRQERRLPDLVRARQQLLLARFFRRYGRRIWQREAA